MAAMSDADWKLYTSQEPRPIRKKSSFVSDRWIIVFSGSDSRFTRKDRYMAR